MKEPYDSIPTQARDWSVYEADRFYDRQTISSHVDDGAELYLTFGFQEAFIRRYSKVDDPEVEIMLDVYDMGSSDEAFGIFSCEREDEDIGIGQGSEYGGGLLRFWKDRYFISMVSLGDEEYARPAMMDIARGVAEAIPDEGRLPILASRLPGEGMLESSLRYFHNMQCLNNSFFLASENILSLSKDSNCVFASFEREEEAGFLLLVEYIDDQKAAKARETFLAAFMPETERPGILQMRNSRWSHAKGEGRFLSIVFDAPNPEWSTQLLSEVSMT